MEISKIHIECMEKSGFSTVLNNKLKHIKTLPYLSIVQAVEGSYDIKIADGEVYNTGEKGFFIAPSNVQQTIVHNANKSDIMNCRWIFLEIIINDVYNFDKLFEIPIIVPEKLKEEMNSLFDKLFISDNKFDEYIYCYEIVKLIFGISAERKTIISKQSEGVLKYIKANYQRKITINDIAKNVNLSESHLFSVFKKEMGISPIAYLNNYRLSLAANELLKTDKTISEIADYVGIGDAIYFNKLFRKAYQTSPSRYRELCKKSRE